MVVVVVVVVMAVVVMVVAVVWRVWGVWGIRCACLDCCGGGGWVGGSGGGSEAGGRGGYIRKLELIHHQSKRCCTDRQNARQYALHIVSSTHDRQRQHNHTVQTAWVYV